MSWIEHAINTMSTKSLDGKSNWEIAKQMNSSQLHLTLAVVDKMLCLSEEYEQLQ